MMATIKNLPPELLVEIFSHYVRSEGQKTFFRNIPRVCKDWNKIASDSSSLWRNVKSGDWKFLLNLSRRGLLYNTRCLECVYYVTHVDVMNLSKVLKNIRDLKALVLDTNVCNDVIKIVAECCPHLERLDLDIYGQSKTTLHEWDQFLNICGPTLKYLSLKFCYPEKAGQHLVLGIGAKCPLLERIEFHYVSFPVHVLRSGYSRLRELKLYNCELVTDEGDDSIGCALKYLKKFTAINCDFGGFDVYSLLKESVDLEHLELDLKDNLVLNNISKLPSEKVRVLDIFLRGLDETLGNLVWKWRRTLSVLRINFLNRNIKADLDYWEFRNNDDPEQNWRAVWNKIDMHFFDEFIQECRNLIYLELGWKKFIGREEIERSFGIPQEITV